MNGSKLALGAVGALALVGLAKRGSASRAGPRLVREVPRAKVEAHWLELRREGKHKGYPQESFRWKHDRWVEVEVPLELVDAVDCNDRARVGRYSDRAGTLPPGLALYGKHGAKRGAFQVHLVDGNHRFNAARLRGEPTFLVYMPEEDWRRFLIVAQRHGSAVKKRLSDLYHTTSHDSMTTIARYGLSPDLGGHLFSHGGMGGSSRGKVFVSEGQDAALEWFGKIDDMLAHRADDDDPGKIVPVMLRLARRPTDLKLDKRGSDDVISGRSLFTRKTVHPEDLLFWHPIRKTWVPVEDWDHPDPMLGISEVEHYDDDGDVVEEDESWTSRGFYTIDPYDDGGFKPPSR